MHKKAAPAYEDNCPEKEVKREEERKKRYRRNDAMKNGFTMAESVRQLTKDDATKRNVTTPWQHHYAEAAGYIPGIPVT
jgi:hypothetical protein